MTDMGGSKYQPLLNYLQSHDRPEVTLTFAEIEALLSATLPKSARQNKGWWGNRVQGALQASAWIDAGYRVAEVDLSGEEVKFHRPTSIYRVERLDGVVLWNSESIKALRHQMGLTQNEMAEQLGVRQQTISEWENGVYAPNRATSKYLNMVAEQAGFNYGLEDTD